MNNHHIIDVMKWEVYTIEWEAFTMPRSKHIRCTCWYVVKMIASRKPEKRVGKPKEEWFWWRGGLFAEKYVNRDCFSCIQLIVDHPQDRYYRPSLPFLIGWPCFCWPLPLFGTYIVPRTMESIQRGTCRGNRAP